MSTCPVSAAGHARSNDPRREGRCVKCGGELPIEPTLPEHTEAVFRLLAETLESAGDKPRDLPCPEFDHLRFETLKRVHWGQEKFGDRWRSKDFDLPLNAREEAYDFMVYLAGEISVSDDARPHLWSALVNMYRAHRDVLADAAAQKGSP